MELIKSTHTNYDEYESLLLERDQAQKEAGQIWTCYIQTFGKLIADVYEEKIECIKCRKTMRGNEQQILARIVNIADLSLHNQWIVLQPDASVSPNRANVASTL